jgi:hypothetical protein
MSSVASAAAAPLDFAALLSREYRPARLAQIEPKQKATLIKDVNNNAEDAVDLDDDDDDDDDLDHHDAEGKGKKKKKTAPTPQQQLRNKLLHDLTEDAAETPTGAAIMSDVERDEETCRLVLQLASKTPAYVRHSEPPQEDLMESLKSYILEAPKNKTAINIRKISKTREFSPKFHEVELGNWESQIQWGGYEKQQQQQQKQKQETTSNGGDTSTNTNTNINTTSPNDATQLLQQRRNPFLEDVKFDDLISWGGANDPATKRKELPLILELGVAGRSIARHVLPSRRPMPCVKSEEYRNRMEEDWTGDVQSTAELNKGTLHADKDKMERLIAKRQEKRRQMAKDKTNRVTEAMGTLDVLAGGRGRTITSSLMGPGGTERTGRPSRHVGNVNHDTEYIEQLDMVTNHVLVRDLSKVTLRQYHRPKLPLTVVRTTLIWQFCIRHVLTNKKGSAPAASASGETANSSSYQAMMMGTHAGAVSKAKLRTEADLSPTEGNLILIEYAEERPPIQMTKGTASKIVTYYRGDKSRCPVSAGGGDRPTRRKRAGAEATKAEKKVEESNKPEKPPRLVGPNHALETTITDWVGKPPKKTREDRSSEKTSINIAPEGVTEILHPKVHGPFIGEIDDGQAVTGLITNLFVAPIFRHEPESTDFLMILGRNSGASIPGRHETLSVVLRELPSSIFAVGQTEPRTRVYAPNTQGEKSFVGPFVSYQIAKALARTEAREGHGLRFDEIHDRVLPNLGLAGNALRQRLKHVAIYDKNTQIWTTKSIGYEDYPGVDALGKQIASEGVAAYEVAAAATRRLRDFGIHQLFSGSHAVSSVGVTMIYLAGQVNATKELARKVKKLGEVSKSNKGISAVQIRYYEDAAAVLDTMSKALRQRHEVAKFIYEELQLAPWHMTGEFIDVHKKGEGTGMMKLTGLGDPSGIGEGFSFLREVDSKPTKSVGPATIGQTPEMKKITGTEDDLRKLTMKQMARILRSYGMAQKQIDTLKRWDRVHVIRDLSTKAAADGIGDGLERFARGEKMKLSEQKQMYRDRIQVIWKRELAALTADTGDRTAADGTAAGTEMDEAAPAKAAQAKKDDAGGDGSSSESDDDFEAEMEQEMMDRPEANQLVAAQATEGAGGGTLGQLRNAAQDQDLSKDARELAALKRQREEERAAREGFSVVTTTPAEHTKSMINRKIVRRRIIKTYPDGRQTVAFKYITHPDEVGKIMSRLEQQKPGDRRKSLERPEYSPDEKQIGHAMFEDEDEFDFTTRGGRGLGGKRRGAGRRGRAGGSAKAPPRKKNEFQFGKLKNKVSKEQRLKKRRREEEESEIYESVSKKKGTNNRKERGSIRERRPHVILADRLESIRSMIESRPSSAPFVKPVNRRALPRYYEVISHPIDLATIRDKIQK